MWSELCEDSLVVLDAFDESQWQKNLSRWTAGKAGRICDCDVPRPLNLLVSSVMEDAGVESQA